MVISIDPGTTESAVLKWDGKTVLGKEKLPNASVLAYLGICVGTEHLVIEMVQSFGMPVGREVFQTVLWVGRFLQFWHTKFGNDAELVYRSDIKMHHCRSARAKDANIRQALIDKYGPPGVKRAPGVTYGISGDLWSAFAIATFITERHPENFRLSA